VGETEFHSRAFFETAWCFDLHFVNAPDVYVWGNMLLYYAEGDPDARVCPDLFLVRGVPKHPRRTYKLWEEGEAPSLVIEFTSESTRQEDLGFKKDLYERLGIEEYFLFDPLGEYLKPRLQGYQLQEGRYRSLPPGPDGSLLSRTTGLSLAPDRERLRLREIATGHRLPWTWEVLDLTRATLARLEDLEARSESALAKLDALEEEAKDVEARAKAAEDRLRALDQEFSIFRNEPVN
ncbi:MAG TPA: Uma2 family endonuclease, partial [Thermoanaerobaculia bacterium]